MNRQVAFAYATAGVAASIAAIVMVGSAFGFGLPAAAPAAAGDWVDPAATAETEDYEAQQAAYEASLAEYQQTQAEAAQAQIDADWWSVHNQRVAAQDAAAADVEAQREAGLTAVEAQIAAQQAAAAAELQAWIDEQRAGALDALAADIGARDQDALDDLEARLAETQGTAPAASTVTQAAPAPPAPQPAAAAQPTAAPTAAPTAVPTAAPTASPTPAPTATAAPAPSVEYLTYGVGGVGEVVLAYTDGNSLSLYGVYSGAGWVYEAERNGPRTVKLKFFNTQTEDEAEWKATIEDGRIKVEN